MRILIVNADDLGVDEQRNRGILEAASAGAVSSVSVLANGPALAHALRGLHALGARRPSVGVHVNLSQGRPLAGDLRRLVNRGGTFLGREGAHRLLLRRHDAELAGEIARETAAQIEALMALGLTLDHLDGHQHVHVFPSASEPVAREAARHGIPWIRLPDEADPRVWDPGARGAALREAERFSRLARRARPVFARRGLRMTNAFRGLASKSRLSPAGLGRLARLLGPGVTELMVHPGRAPEDPSVSLARGFTFSTADRERELEALLCPAWRTALVHRGAILAGFPTVEAVGR